VGHDPIDQSAHQHLAPLGQMGPPGEQAGLGTAPAQSVGDPRWRRKPGRARRTRCARRCWGSSSVRVCQRCRESRQPGPLSPLAYGIGVSLQSRWRDMRMTDPPSRVASSNGQGVRGPAARRSPEVPVAC
jgi:hypothetical protein